MHIILLLSKFQDKNCECIQNVHKMYYLSTSRHYMLPVFVSKRLSKCLSPTPRIYVITQYPAATTVQKKQNCEKHVQTSLYGTLNIKTSCVTLIFICLLLFFLFHLNSQIKLKNFDSLRVFTWNSEEITICNKKNTFVKL